ncbi:MAG: CAP domain-containing protein [Lacibacter sp.]
MFHVKHVIVFLCLFLSFKGHAQGILTLRDKPFVYSCPIDSVLFQSLNSGGYFGSLSKTEQETVYWVNYFRQNPRRFWNTVMKEFLIQFPEAKSSYTRTLEADILRAPESLQVVYPDSGLISMAVLHANDLKKRHGIITHVSSSGKNFVQRIQAVGRYSCGAENIFNGSFSGLEALIALLIDQGVPDRGHRMNILDPRFQLIGVSFINHRDEKGILVQDFACH